MCAAPDHHTSSGLDTTAGTTFISVTWAVQDTDTQANVVVYGAVNNLIRLLLSPKRVLSLPLALTVI